MCRGESQPIPHLPRTKSRLLNPPPDGLSAQNVALVTFLTQRCWQRTVAFLPPAVSRGVHTLLVLTFVLLFYSSVCSEYLILYQIYYTDFALSLLLLDDLSMSFGQK